jgi:hypothetical protein
MPRPSRMKSIFGRMLMILSPGGCIILLIAGLSTLVIMFRPLPGLEGQAVWIYTPRHAEIYKRELAQWNRLHPDNRAHLGLFEYHAFQRRLLSGFLAGTPVGDLIEVERNMIGPTFTGARPESRRVPRLRTSEIIATHGTKVSFVILSEAKNPERLH